MRDARAGPRPPRVGVDLRALVGRPSGIGLFTLGLLSELARRRRFDFLGLAQAPVAGAGELGALGVEVDSVAAPLGVLWQQLVLPRRLRALAADVLWSPLMTLPARCPTPAVLTLHDLTTVLYPETHRLRVRWSILPFLERSVEVARGIAVDSRATAADVARAFPQCAGKIEVVYPGVDADFRPAGEDERRRIRLSIGCPDGYVLFAGTLEPRKNVGTLLAAWQALRAEHPGFPPLVLAGPPGWRSGALEAAAARTTGVVRLGYVERARLIELFRAASLFVYPSLYEGFGLPVAEAMACAVPVVASDRSSLPEIVGDAGLLVDPGDPGGLSAAMATLIADHTRAADLGARGAERVRRFRWETAAAAMEELFQRALE